MLWLSLLIIPKNKKFRIDNFFGLILVIIATKIIPMKKIPFLILAFVVFAFNINIQAQEAPFRKGKVEIKGGIAGPNWIGSAVDIIPDGAEEGKNPIPFAGEINYYFGDNFSLGLYGTYFKINSDKYNINFEVNDTIFVRGLGQISLSRTAIALKPAYTFGKDAAFNPYVAGVLGVRINKFTGKADLEAEFGELTESEVINEVLDHLVDLGLKKDLDFPVTMPIFGIQLGAKYYFTPNIGAFAELGLGGVPLASAGINFRF